MHIEIRPANHQTDRPEVCGNVPLTGLVPIVRPRTRILPVFKVLTRLLFIVCKDCLALSLSVFQLRVIRLELWHADTSDLPPVAPSLEAFLEHLRPPSVSQNLVCRVDISIFSGPHCKPACPCTPILQLFQFRTRNTAGTTEPQSPLCHIQIAWNCITLYVYSPQNCY